MLQKNIKVLRLVLLGIFIITCFSSLSAQNHRIDSLKSVLNSYQNLSKESLTTINDLFEEHHYMGNESEATRYADLLVEKAQELNNPNFVRQGRLNKAWILVKENKEKSKAIVNELLDEAIKEGDKLIEGQCYLYIGNFSRNYLYQLSGCSYFEKAEEAFQNIETIHEIHLMTALVMCKINNEEYNKSLTQLQQIYIKAKRTNRPSLEAKVLKMILFYQKQLVLNNEASKTAHQIIRLSEKNNYYTIDLLFAYTSLAKFYNNSKKNDEALKYYELAYGISQHINDNDAKIRVADNLARHYINHDSTKYDKAEDLLRYSIDLAKKNNLNQKHLISLYSLGCLDLRRGNKKEAKEKFLTCLSISDTSSVANPRYNIKVKSRLSNLLNSFPPGFDKFFPDDYQGESNIDSLNIYTRERAYEIKKNMALSRKDYAKAYTWYEKEVNVRLKVIDAEHEVNVKERALEAQLYVEKEHNLKTQELLSTTKLVNKLLILASIFFIFLIGLGIKQFRDKKKFNHEILQKNEKISSAMNEIKNLNTTLTEKNELLQSKNKVKNQELLDFITFKSKRDHELVSIKKDFDKILKAKTLNPIDLKLIQTRIDQSGESNNNEWITFKQKIEEAYPNFFTNLSLKHPQLTEKDRFHCAYLLLGMTVKAVADVTFVSQTTVNSSRYRIKKKMAIGKEIKLKDYLLQINQI